MQNIFSFDAIVNQLIRPVKFTYSLSDLGSSIFTLQENIYERHDFTVFNANHNKLHASIFKQKEKEIKNVIVYIHCNCGSRIQGLQFMNDALRNGYEFVCFDSRGCGHSEGDYISLGFHETNDVKVVINKIKQNYNENANFILWGRSMGAVAALRYLTTQESDTVFLAVLDSPFLNVKQVICQIAKKKIGTPKFMIDLFLRYLDPIIKEKANFHFEDLNLRDQIKKIKCPLILLASKLDGVVPYHHLEEIYEKYSGRKSIFYLQENHTDKRCQETVEKAFKAINRYFLSQLNSRKNEKKALNFCKSSQFTPIKKKISITSHGQSIELEESTNRKSKKKYLRTYLTEEKANKGRESYQGRIKDIQFSTPLTLQKNILNLQNVAKNCKIKLF